MKPGNSHFKTVCYFSGFYFLNLAKINVGRIAALMAYCYHLVKVFIMEKVASSGVIFSFMCLVAGWLFKVFIKAKFYQWLQNQGGWVSDSVMHMCQSQDLRKQILGNF